MTDERDPARLSGQQANAEREIEQLLTQAGHRPDVPELRKARVKNATRLAWRRQTERRSRRRAIYRLAAAAAAVAAVLTIWIAAPWRPAADPSDSWAQIVRWTGDAPAVTAEGRAALSLTVGERTRVAFGSSVSTGPEGRVTLELATGHELRVDADSRVRLVSETVIAVERGAIYVDSRSEFPGAPRSYRKITVATPYAEVQEIGTRYEVRLDDGELRVRVRDGRVGLSVGGDTYQAETGTQLILDRDGSVTRDAMPIHGTSWDWVLSAAISPQIDRRPLGEFLAWVERETGWTVEYADPELAKRAPEIVMSGSIDGLGPIGALDAVIPVCGLKYRIDGSRLVLTDR